MKRVNVRENANKILGFKTPGSFSDGIASRLPEAYKKFWNEWKEQDPSPVHYIPNEGKWKRNPNTGEVQPIQNIPIPVLHVKESHEGIWGGEAVIKGFKKKGLQKRRVAHYWFPVLRRTVIYSEILNKYMSMVVTNRTLELIHKNYGFDHYILKTPACDLQSLLALKLKRKMLLALLKKDLYPEDPLKQEETYKTYKKYLENYTEEEIDWYGLHFLEAIKKQTKIEEAQYQPQPLKIVYRAQLLEKLKEVGKEGLGKVLEEHGLEQKKSWLSKINPFSSKN